MGERQSLCSVKKLHLYGETLVIFYAWVFLLLAQIFGHIHLTLFCFLLLSVYFKDNRSFCFILDEIHVKTIYFY